MYLKYEFPPIFLQLISGSPLIRLSQKKQIFPESKIDYPPSIRKIANLK
jgi:hypothetical protein